MTLARGEIEERRFGSWDMLIDPVGIEEFALFQKTGCFSGGEGVSAASGANLLSFIQQKAMACPHHSKAQCWSV